MKFEWAPTAYRRLNGVICVYKPLDISVYRVMKIIQTNIAKDLNALPCYRYEREQMELETSLPVPTNVNETMLDLTDHKLVLGPRYIPEDIKMKQLHGLTRESSGVLLLGIGSGCAWLKELALARYLRAYHLKGRLGWATDNFMEHGKIIQRTSFHHVTKPRLDAVCSATQAAHQRHMFEYAGVDIQSQEAYEMASTGLVRPESRDAPPMLYGVKCIDFKPPDFTLEVHAINERCAYLMKTIHDVGVELKTTAICTQLRRIRYGHFTLEHALLRKHWTLEHIIDNIAYCWRFLQLDKILTSQSIQIEKPARKLLTVESEEI